MTSPRSRRCPRPTTTTKPPSRGTPTPPLPLPRRSGLRRRGLGLAECQLRRWHHDAGVTGADGGALVECAEVDVDAANVAVGPRARASTRCLESLSEAHGMESESCMESSESPACTPCSCGCIDLSLSIARPTLGLRVQLRVHLTYLSSLSIPIPWYSTRVPIDIDNDVSPSNCIYRHQYCVGDHMDNDNTRQRNTTHNLYRYWNWVAYR